MDIHQIASLAMSDSVSDLLFDPADLPMSRNQQGLAWIRITGAHYERLSKSKVSTLAHPVLRVVHRLLSSTVYARQEPSIMLLGELILLKSMTSAENPSYRPCFGSFLCLYGKYKNREAEHDSSRRLGDPFSEDVGHTATS